MGHEASGVISSIGSAVTNLKPGDKVAVEPGFPCRRCDACKGGKYNLCDDVKFAAAPPDCHGCLTKFFRVPEDFCYKLTGPGFDLGTDEGVLLEPLAVAVHVVRQGRVIPGQKVVILGVGTIGFLCAAVVQAYGATAAVCDIADKRLQFAAKKLGCFTFNLSGRSPEENAEALREAWENKSEVDSLLECSGAEPAMQMGIHVLRKGGTFVQAGLGKPIQMMPILLMSEKELDVKGSFRYGPGDFEQALSLLSQGKVNVKALIGSVVPFERATEAWEKTRKGEGVKNLIEGPKD